MQKYKPVPKIAATGLAGVLVTALVAILAAFGVIVPEDVTNSVLVLVVAVSNIVVFVAGYMKKN